MFAMKLANHMNLMKNDKDARYQPTHDEQI